MRRRTHGGRRSRRLVIGIEPEALYADLVAAQVSGQSDPAERRRDFQRVFLNDTTGKRVLHTLLGWTHLYRSSVVDGDACATHVLEGERSIGLKLLAMLIVEPAPVAEASAEPPDGSPKGDD